jgi:hypothetical protein
MRRGLIVLTAAALCACGAHPPAGSPPALGTVTGHILSYPCAPVERASSPCAGRPASHVEIDFQSGAHPPVRGITDASGGYAVQLAPGTYAVSMSVLRIMTGPHSVTVAAGQTLTANYVFDSGIR